MVISLGNEIPRVAPFLVQSPSPAFKSSCCAVVMFCLHGLHLETGEFYTQYNPHPHAYLCDKEGCGLQWWFI